eukprot:TRINITY_DN3930_c0_g1_i2.p1 TRINITY_DN3930_c0_g1~~TRINITY_DN3930_c0_g1_i2.p1  ORF type:complete len:112 (-),score=56.85 TRINITY_DN3930_c0_g1_i2:54-389(-)
MCIRDRLGSLISDVNTLKANALVMRKEAEDTEHRSEEIAATCDNLVNQSAAALAVVQAVRWKRKIGTKKRAEDALGAGPVSYTHLRAHETVLDLVCRLLLEKKKKNKPHNK